MPLVKKRRTRRHSRPECLQAVKYFIMSVVPRNISSIFYSNSEANTSNLLENLEELFSCYGLQWTVVDCSGLQWTIVDCSGLQWTVVDCSGLLWTVVDCCQCHKQMTNETKLFILSLLTAEDKQTLIEVMYDQIQIINRHSDDI